MPTAYRIGELARTTGLSVRTLRHYDAEELLVPSGRTDAGHRRYTDADVARLQQIVSLRAVGLPLGEIRALLADADALAVLERHLAHVRAQIERHTRLAHQLSALADHLRRTGAARTGDLLRLIHLTIMFEKHYTPDQLDQLRARADALGPDALARVQQQWADLFARFDALRVAGADPAGPDVQALVAEAKPLLAAFTGGDAGIQQSLNTAYAENQGAMYEAWGISPDLGRFYHAAMSAAA